jgi:hypothetical protein
MLQNLANKPTYAKEAYMMTLNPFVENNKARINKFLNDLCEVGDFYESLEVWLPCAIFFYSVFFVFFSLSGNSSLSSYYQRVETNLLRTLFVFK